MMATKLAAHHLVEATCATHTDELLASAKMLDEPAHRAPVQHMLGANELTYNAEHIIRIEKVRAAAPSPPPLSRRAATRRAPLLLSRLPSTSEQPPSGSPGAAARWRSIELAHDLGRQDGHGATVLGMLCLEQHVERFGSTLKANSARL